MSVRSPRSRLAHLSIPARKQQHEQLLELASPSGGHLTPDLQPSPPPAYSDPAAAAAAASSSERPVRRVGPFYLCDAIDASSETYDAIHCDSQQRYVCKVMPVAQYRDVLAPYFAVGEHPNINGVAELVLGETKAYAFFAPKYKNLHAYIRDKKKLREPEARALFAQVVAAVHRCHQNGVVLRDLKLRKFVFCDPELTQLKLEGLEDAKVLQDEADDRIEDKHGCPAYASPEILCPKGVSYSGQLADMWGLGVILYTMLAGRYPFHDTKPTVLFMKIRKGLYRVPDFLSPRAQCLVRCLLRQQPEQRLLTDDVLLHPWFRQAAASSAARAGRAGPGEAAAAAAGREQAVPEWDAEQDVWWA